MFRGIKRKLIASSIVCCLTFCTIGAQEKTHWSIGTNVLTDVVFLAPNVQISYYVGKQSVFSVGGNYGWWDFGWGQKYAAQHWSVTAEYSYYLKQETNFTGHHLGIGLQTGQYDWKRKSSAQRGQFSTVGLIYGYTWKLKENWYLDAGVGLGYLYRFYHKYSYRNEDDKFYCTSHPTKHAFAPTNFNASIIYRF